MGNRLRIWLDDTRPIPEGYTHSCRWPSEVIALLQKAEQDGDIVECVSLDHDLGDIGATKERTGYDVIAWIEEQVITRGFIPPRTCLIHTDNPVARDRMMSARKSAYTKAQSMGINWRR